MSVNLELFFAEQFGNHIHHIFIFTFVVLLFLKLFDFFAQAPIEYKWFSNGAMDKTLTSTTTMGQSGHGSNGNEDVLSSLRSYPGHWVL